MTYSLNEADVTAKKAARGAGYSWGVAEDTGKAVRFLCQNGLDGCGALAALLTELEAVQKDQLTLVKDQGVWTSKAGALCPITLGVAVADRAHEIDQSPCRGGQTHAPLLVLPFAALIARSLNRVVTVTCDEAMMTTNGTQLCVTGTVPDIAKTVTVACSSEIGNPNPLCARAAPRASDWDTLNRFAHRTYAPATEESRLKGAG